jgi:hypothetical protein
VELSEEHGLLLNRQRKINEEIAQVVAMTYVQYRLILVPRLAAHSSSTAVANLQKEKFASITHDVAASSQTSKVQTQVLKEAYAEGWCVERNSIRQGPS